MTTPPDQLDLSSPDTCLVASRSHRRPRPTPARPAPTLVGFVLAALLGAPGLSAQLTLQPELHGETLLERVGEVLSEYLFDEELRGRVPALVEPLLDEARAAQTLEEQRIVADRLLQQIPVSHLGLLSRRAQERFVNELLGNPGPTLGFELEQHDGGFYATWVLEGGPAARAGLLSGHRVLAIDGVPPEESPRVDWRTDDSALPDPPKHLVFAEPGEAVVVTVDGPTGELDLEIPVDTWSALRAAEGSVRTIDHEGVSVGYLHLWFIHINGVVDLVREALQGPLVDADALILDLRGRGGNPLVVFALLDLLGGDERIWHRPVVALVDRGSRSAKDVMAWELRERGLATLVGECTAGAVLPATFAEVGADTILMYPAFQLDTYSPLLEGRCVEPDVPVSVDRPLPPGADPILERGLEEAWRLVSRPTREAP